MQDSDNDKEERWTSGAVTALAFALALGGFGLLGSGTITGQASGGGQQGCGGSYDEDAGQLGEGGESSSDIQADESRSGIEAFYIKPNLEDGWSQSDFETRVSVAPSGTLVLVSFEDTSAQKRDNSHLKLVEAHPNKGGKEWVEIATLRLDELRKSVDFDAEILALEDNTVYSSFIVGEQILKYFKAEERWQVLSAKEMRSYLGSVKQSPSTRLYQELKGLRPISVDSSTIERAVSPVLGDDTPVNVANYSYAATKVVAVSLDVGAAMIVPDCGLGNELVYGTQGWACQTCAPDSMGKPDCTVKEEWTLEDEYGIPKPSDVFLHLESLDLDVPSIREREPAFGEHEFINPY